MSYLQPFFLFFFVPISVLIFFLSVKIANRVWGLLVIVIFSVIFYSFSGLSNFLLLIASVSVNYVLGSSLLVIPIERSRPRLYIHAVGQIFNFSILIFFKYIRPELEGVAVEIPPGISFYTFQLAIFLLGCFYSNFDSRNSPKPFTKNDLLSYLSFALFFPRLLIGPIVLRDEFFSQIERKSFGKFSRIGFEVGAFLIVVGLFKKIVLADRLGTISDPVFTAAASHQGFSPLQAWASILSYYAQLYFDFSGYSDIALGLGKLFGIRLPINFDSPLKAAGIADFYRRWHITLTRVIARFVYTELSLRASRFALGRGWPTRSWKTHFFTIWLPFLVNFEIIALWHGINSAIIVFGFLHGIWYALETEMTRARFWKNFRGKFTPRRLYLVGFALTALPLMLSFALFRSVDFSSFIFLMRRAFFVVSGDHSNVVLVNVAIIRNLLVCYAILWLLPNSIQICRRYQPALQVWKNDKYVPHIFDFVWRPNLLWFAVMILLAVLVAYYYGRPTRFIYMGF